MSKPRKSAPSAPEAPDESDNQSYFAIGIVFIVAGVVFFISDSSRAMSLSFLVLGFTFFILSQDKSSKK